MMSAHDDGKAREESQAVLDAMEKYEQLKQARDDAKAAGDVLAYRKLKHEVFLTRRELAKLTNEK